MEPNLHYLIKTYFAMIKPTSRKNFIRERSTDFVVSEPAKLFEFLQQKIGSTKIRYNYRWTEMQNIWVL
jgi:hypothetical protein